MRYALERKNEDGSYRTVGLFDNQDAAERIAAKLTRTTGIEHRVTEAP